MPASVEVLKSRSSSNFCKTWAVI